MAVVEAEIRGMAVRPLRGDVAMAKRGMETAPICGFCVVKLQVRPKLRRQQDGGWRCIVCGAVTYHPSDNEATARDLEVMFVEGAESTRQRQEQALNEYLAKPRIVEPGPIERTGAKAAKKRKTKAPPYRWYRTFGDV